MAKVNRGLIPGFGERLARARAEKGLTQQALAAQIGISKDMPSRWEREENVPELMTAIQLSEVLDVTLDWLCKGDGQARVVGEDHPEYRRFLAEVVPTLATPPTAEELERVRAVAYHRADADDFARSLRQIRRGLSDAQIRAEERATRAVRERGDGIGVRKRSKRA